MNKDGKYYAVTDKGKNKFSNNEVIGNLKELFTKYSNDSKPSNNFFNQQRKYFRGEGK